MSNEEEKEPDVLHEVTHCGFMRNISIHVHMDRPMKPEEFMAELADIVANYQDYPEELFISADIEDPQ